MVDTLSVETGAPSVPGTSVVPGPIDGPLATDVLVVGEFEGIGDGCTPFDGDSDAQPAATTAASIATKICTRRRIAPVSHATGPCGVTVDTMRTYEARR